MPFVFFTANAKGAEGCIAVLEEDGTLIEDDDVVKELEKNTVVMIVNSQDAWKSPTCKTQGEQNMVHESKNTEKDGNMRLESKGGNLQLRKPTALVNFELFLLIIYNIFLHSKYICCLLSVNMLILFCHILLYTIVKDAVVKN